MCGIAGIYLKRRDLSTTRFPVERMADELMLNIQSRGTHATGYVAASADGTQVVCEKQDIPAEYFVQLREDLPDSTKTLLMHTRFATQGSPSQNENNHPVKYGGTFVTHNGVVYNDDWLFKTELETVERVAEVDSIVFPTLIDEFGWENALKSLELVTGSYAVACIQPDKNPDELIVARGEQSPVHYYLTDQVLVWASEAWHLEQAWQRAYGTPPKVMHHLEEGHALICAKDEITVVKYMEPPVKWVQQQSFGGSSRRGWAWERGREERDVYVEHRGSPNRDCTECGEHLGTRAITGFYKTDTHDCKWRVFVCEKCFKDGKETPDDLNWNYIVDPVETWLTPLPEKKKDFRSCGTLRGDHPNMEEFLALQPGQLIPDSVAEAFAAVDCEICGSWSDIYALDDDGMPICRECYLAMNDSSALEKCDDCQVYTGSCIMTMMGNLCEYCRGEADRIEASDHMAEGFDVCGACNRVKRSADLLYTDTQLPSCVTCLGADLDRGLQKALEQYRELGEDLFETDESMKTVAEEYRLPTGVLTYVCFRANVRGDADLWLARKTMMQAVSLAVKARRGESAAC